MLDPTEFKRFALQGIDEELAKLEARKVLLQNAKAALLGETPSGGMSAEARQRISEAQKKRWAKVRKQKK